MKRAILMMVTGLALIFSAPAGATIVGTYVDAEPGVSGNTVRTSDSTDGITGGWLGLSLGQWNNRGPDSSTSASEFNDVLENAADNVSVHSPALTTTVTGLNPALAYNIYVIYHTANTTAGGSVLPSFTDWHIQAGLTASPLTIFDSSNGLYTGSSVDLGPFFVNEREALLGQVTGVSSFSVFVDDTLNAGSSDLRARYDGVAFEVIAIPEPGIVGLLLVGGLMTWRRSQRR